MAPESNAAEDYQRIVDWLVDGPGIGGQSEVAQAVGS
jgi:hypothetical protein